MTYSAEDTERFWAKVDQTLMCWEWTAATFTNGYGMFTLRGHPLKAHRFAYELLVGRIPESLQLDHTCFNRRCVNPDHLEPVTARENSRRAKARITHCPRNHPLVGQNLYLHNGKRDCLTCRRERSRIWMRAMRATRKET